jgi:hypothetical protein
MDMILANKAVILKGSKTLKWIWNHPEIGKDDGKTTTPSGAGTTPSHDTFSTPWIMAP